jgi:hypothetical protein
MKEQREGRTARRCIEAVDLLDEARELVAERGGRHGSAARTIRDRDARTHAVDTPAEGSNTEDAVSSQLVGYSKAWPAAGYIIPHESQ